MALLNKIRERSGIAVGIVAFGLILFMLGADVLSPQSLLFNNNDIGEIDGVSITPQMYDNAVKEQENSYISRTGQRPGEPQMRFIRDQAWRKLIADIAFGNQYKEVGIVVTDDERFDMVQGQNLAPEVLQLFTNPETGQYDPAQVQEFFANFNQQPLEVQLQWQNIENTLVDARTRLKYESLIIKSSYVTTAEAQRDYEQKNAVAEVRYLYVPYYSIPDSAINISDSDLRSYYNAHKEEYTVETEARSISYAVFPINASDRDTAEVMQAMNALVQDFRTTDNDSVFARNNSATRRDFYGEKNPGNMPDVLKDQFQDLQQGDVVGPLLEGNEYAAYKVSAVNNDGETGYARASHILIRSNGEEDEAEAREKALDIISQIRNGADFGAMALQHGTDGTASKGGDLGWFDENTMVSEFSEAVFSSNREGLLPSPVKTQFGFHIIEITSLPVYRTVTLARIDAEITPSTATDDEAYRKADMLRAAAGGSLSGLGQAGQSNGVNILAADNIGPTAYNVGNYQGVRDLVRWLFNDASQGDMAEEIFRADNAYIVAAMSGIQEAGVLPFEAVRSQVTIAVTKEKKAQAIMAKLGDVSGKSIDDLAGTYGPDATINTSSDLRASNNNIPGIGFAPIAVGAAFGLQEGGTSQLIEEANGVVLLTLEALTPAVAQNNYESNRSALMSSRQSANAGSISNAIESGADIEDQRYKVQ